VKGDIFSVVKSFQLVAHVLEEKSIFLGIDLKSTLQKSENELDATDGDHSSLVHVYNVPGDLNEKKCNMQSSIITQEAALCYHLTSVIALTKVSFIPLTFWSKAITPTSKHR
jgi:hypothetical protein